MPTIRGPKDIKTGQQVWVYHRGEAYRTMVADTSPGRIATAYPFPPEVTFAPGMDVALRFVAGQRAFKITGKTAERTSSPDLLWVHALGPLEEIERRRAFRVWTAAPVSLRLKHGAGDWAEGYTQDVSAGGFRARFADTQLRVGEGQSVKFSVSLPTHTWEGEALVRRATELEDAGCLEVGVEWVGATEAETDRLIAFLFQEQLTLRKKGLL